MDLKEIKTQVENCVLDGDTGEYYVSEGVVGPLTPTQQQVLLDAFEDALELLKLILAEFEAEPILGPWYWMRQTLNKVEDLVARVEGETKNNT